LDCLAVAHEPIDFLVVEGRQAQLSVLGVETDQALRPGQGRREPGCLVGLAVDHGEMDDGADRFVDQRRRRPRAGGAGVVVDVRPSSE
jgi:hypothetical protein